MISLFVCSEPDLKSESQSISAASSCISLCYPVSGDRRRVVGTHSRPAFRRDEFLRQLTAKCAGNNTRPRLEDRPLALMWTDNHKYKTGLGLA